ncbi:MAG: restriction endonuclease [Anaerolineaceae bacterium]|nr:restriction endonuclease [Anaerolineaceae bacterium]
MSVEVPTFDAMMNPLLQGLKNLGGSGTIKEIADEVSKIINLSDEQLEVIHNPEKGGQTEFEYRLSWTRTYLKKYGLLENSSRGIWALNPNGRKTSKVNPKKVVHEVRSLDKSTSKIEEKEISLEDNVSPENLWQEDLQEVLLEMSPDAFERLAQRILRESGFIQVEVTGKTGDGGIDGKGIMRLSGLLSFHVYFQCKRYKGSVSSSQIRDFRGAMTGRADKGLFITTGTFTKGALTEATRDGAPPLDLIDGEQLVDLLKNLSLGVKTEKVQKEEVTVDQDWFLTI